MYRPLTAALLLVVLLAAGFLYYKYRVAPKIDFTGIELSDLDGKPVRISAYNNKKRFIHFFATWCGPCMKEMPALNHEAYKLHEQNCVFLCISDEPEDRIKAMQIRYPDLIILHSVKKFRDIGIATLPTTYLINYQGELIFKKTGDLTLPLNLPGSQSLPN